ncbi:MAG: AAA family ATPase [Aliarcobacter butzleri]|nr:AAA family ATPase [Aliarcobacter butzleri]
MIREINISNFRAFKNIKFELGKSITVISGHNATGKSTLLGLLGNCAEFKVIDGKPLLQNQFRTEFSEIFKGSKEHDKTGSIARISYSSYEDFDLETDYRDIRVTWQTNKNNNNRRFRLIPSKKDESKESGKTEAKIHWPTLYVGLSRLYPFGELNEEAVTTNQLKLTDSEKKWFIEKNSYILNLNQEVNNIFCTNSSELSRKKPIGINTNTYDYMCNSAGQDNIGQILMSLLSFQRLKETMEKKEKKWEGGLLLIDEIDATLHPVAQNKLYDLLYQEANELRLQIVFTTHSLTLLRHVCTKRMSDGQIRNKCNIIYLSAANGPLDCEINPQYSMIENDMMIQSSFDSTLLDKIIVYSEDSETRWFFKKLIGKYEAKLNILDVYLSCNTLLTIRKKDPRYFSNVLIVVDSDAGCNNTKSENCTNGNCECKFENVLVLPKDRIRPEQVFYEYLINLPPNHSYLVKYKSKGLTISYFREKNPLSEKYNDGRETKERDRFKLWFNDMIEIFENTNLFESWSRDNKEIVDSFLKNFIKQYNKIAYPNLLERIDDYDNN